METSHKKITILLAEDDLDLREIYKQKLTSDGFDVIAAKDGKEAIEKLNGNEQIKAVISDIVMPEMDGFDVLRTIKNSNKYKNLPVIMLTSLSDYEDRGEALKMGADRYFVKPERTPTQLSEEIKEVLTEKGLL